MFVVTLRIRWQWLGLFLAFVDKGLISYFNIYVGIVNKKKLQAVKEFLVGKGNKNLCELLHPHTYKMSFRVNKRFQVRVRWGTRKFILIRRGTKYVNYGVVTRFKGRALGKGSRQYRHPSSGSTLRNGVEKGRSGNLIYRCISGP